MIVAVFTPPSRIDATNVAAFAETVSEHVARHGCIVIDCSNVVWIASAGMRVLDIASHDAPITLVNPSPAVHLMAVAFGGDVRCRYDQVSAPAYQSEATTDVGTTSLRNRVAELPLAVSRRSPAPASHSN